MNHKQNLPVKGTNLWHAILTLPVWAFLLILITSCQSLSNEQSDENNPDSRSNLTLASIELQPGRFNENTGDAFKEKQMNYPRVREAYTSKADSVKRLLARKGIHTFSIDLFLRLFKKEQTVEVWAKREEVDTFTHIVDYPFCASSGDLGPKRQEGDYQIPEGFYRISYFNPHSDYHLSLKLNYPNQSDRIKGHPENPGSNIYIHGDCVTIGCIPITDPYIKELYVLAVEAHASGNDRIPVHVFPTHLKAPEWQALQAQNKGRQKLLDFWKDLRPGYLAFEQNKTLPKIHVGEEGSYVVTE